MKASVIIPAFNAAKTIGRSIESLEGQSVSRRDFEIVVVDDGSTDDTMAVVRGFEGVQIIRQKNAGPAAARNAGARAAGGEILVFTDSDCELASDWLFEMLKPFEDASVAGVQGAYRSRQKEWVARFVQLEIEERYERQQKSMRERGKIDFVGSYSAAYRAKDFRDVGGFDESFPTASGEDPDLSFRLCARGARLVFAPNAIVYHRHPSSLFKYWRTKFFRAFWRVKLYAKNPAKVAGDGYTPRVLFVQMALWALALALGGASIVAGFFAPEVSLALGGVVVGALGAIALLSMPMAWSVSRKNLALGIAALGVFSVNGLLFLFGAIAGKCVRT